MNQNPPPTNHSESVGDGDPIPFLVARLDESSPPDSPLSSVDTDLNPSPHSPGEGNSLSYDAEFSRSSDADDDAVSDSEYTVTLTGKRRKACPSSTAVSVSVKARVLRNYGGKCWLCGMVGKHVTHVIAESDRVLFREFSRQGLLHMHNLHVIKNLILLCPGCHGSFDERVPIWAFLPVDLDTFIRREEAFHAQRLSYAAAGQPLARPDPCSGKTPNLQYRRYQIRLGHLLPGVFAEPVKYWLGNPIATILRSQSIVSGITRLDPDTQCGLPDDVAKKLQHLLFLYSTPAPKLQQLLSVRNPNKKRSDGENGSGHGDPSSPSPPSQQQSTPIPKPSGSHPPGRCSQRTNAVTHRTHCHVSEHHARSLSQTSNRHTVHAIPTPPTSNKRPHTNDDKIAGDRKRARRDPRWLFGPRMTANKMVQWHIDARKNAAEEQKQEQERGLGCGVSGFCAYPS